ncbi:MAG: hypothetical protein WD000_03775 [Thermodesulfobacteriota bacterium]
MIEVSEDQADQYLEEFKADIAECPGKSSTYIQLATCENNERIEYYTQIGYKYMDLVELYNAYYLAASSRVQNGTMTIEEAKLVMTLVLQELTSKETERMSSQPNGWSLVLQALASATENYYNNRPITCMHGPVFTTCQ